jgi:hypothetical protein
MIQLISELPNLIGLRCWGVVAGLGNGSMVTFHLGGRIARNPALANYHLSDELREYRGEYCIFVKGCAWNLNVGSRTVCRSTDPERKIGAELTGRLTGATITRSAAEESTANLDVEFGEHGFLHLSCQQASENGIDNYAIRFPFGWIKVDRNKLVRRAPA